MRRAGFRLPHGHSRRVPAVTQTSNNATDDEVSEGESGSLKSSTDNHDGGSEEDHLLATKGIADEDGDDGADETS